MPEYYRANRQNPYGLSSGGLVTRKRQGRFQVLLLKRDKDNTYHLPKGTAYAKETLIATATREIREETGYSVKVKKYLGSLASQFHLADRTLVDKTTHYFWAAPHPAKPRAVMDHEHDAVYWLDLAKAEKLLRDHRFVEKEAEIIKRFRKIKK